MSKKLQREQILPADLLAEKALNEVDNSGKSREDLALEIEKRTAEIEQEKAERKRIREHKRRLKQVRLEHEKKSTLVIPIILIVSISICMILMLCYN